MEKIEGICKKKEESISKQHFEKAAKYRDKEKQLRTEREQKIENWKKMREETTVIVDEEEMLQVVSTWTGIPPVSYTHLTLPTTPYV